MAISPETIEEVNKVANVYDIISDYISLKKTGSVYVALCPFHSEKTPSFVVSPTKNIFKCFGCGISGNAIKFVMEYEKISYFDAVVKIAQKYNIPVKYLNSEKDKVYKGLYLTTRIITQFYKESLKNSSIAKEYLKKRSISPQIVEEFEIGYSPQENDMFYRYIQEKNIQLNDLEKIGLITINENGIRDKFSGRLIFPIKDIKGNIIAFGGRTLQEGKQPKYLNSPDTVIYKKGNTLYGIYESLPYIKEKESVIIVEGYMDLISLHQIGVKNVVATLGTAFTKNQAKLLKKYTKEAIVMFDSDESGKKASIEVAKILLSENITVKYAHYTQAKDPDELSKYGLSKVKEVINNAKDIILFLLERLKETEKLDVELQLKKYQTIYGYITKIIAFIEDPALRNSYIDIVAKVSGRNFQNVEADIEKVRLITQKERQGIQHNQEDESIKLELSFKEKIILKYLNENPDMLQKKDLYDTISNFENLKYILELVKIGNTEPIQHIIDSLQKINVTQESFENILKDLQKDRLNKDIYIDLEIASEENLKNYFNKLKNLKRR